MIDVDHDEEISYDELCKVFGNNSSKFDSKIFKEMFKEIESDGSGEINFEEFERMLLSICT